jgi:hypothetical protein
MPKNDTRPTRVRLRTKKNPDGSQQYVRGDTPEERMRNVNRHRDRMLMSEPGIGFHDDSKKLDMLRAVVAEEMKPTLARIKIRQKRNTQNNNADRSR